MNYYDILNVSPKASRAEIKSAYRRLARKLHPDRNNGSQDTALKFAAIAEAYEILGNPKERSRFDKKILEAQFRNSVNGDSVFTSTNRHARRWRQMVYEKRYNDIIDRMIADERREAMAFQRAIYPAVAIYASTLLVMILRPKMFSASDILGRIIIISLFVVGIIHLISRVREGFETYTNRDSDIHDSILDENERPQKPYSRVGSVAILTAGFLVCIILGYLIGTQVDFAYRTVPSMFAENLRPEVVFYPPIFVFFVDLMHTIASRLER